MALGVIPGAGAAFGRLLLSGDRRSPLRSASASVPAGGDAHRTASPRCHPEEAEPTKDPDGARRDLSQRPDKVPPRRGRDSSLTLRMTEQGPHPAAFRQGSLKGPPRQPAGASAEQALRPSVRTGTPPLSQGGSKGRKTPQSASPTAPLSQGSLTGRKGLKKAGNFRKKVLTRRFCCAILCFTCRTRGFFSRAFCRAESAPASTQGGNAHRS